MYNYGVQVGKPGSSLFSKRGVIMLQASRFGLVIVLAVLTWVST